MKRIRLALLITMLLSPLGFAQMSESEDYDDSGITLSSLSDVQAENVALLIKVWGFLKYHHPQVTTGQVQWDYAFFDILPAVLEAEDAGVRNAVLLEWVNDLGALEPCERCVSLPDPEEIHLEADLNWLEDENLLSEELSKQLQDSLRKPLT